MGSYLIVAVRKKFRNCDLQQISHIAYEESFFNARVIISIEEAIQRVLDNDLAFYVRGSRGKSYVTVEHPLNGKPHLKTSGNRAQADFLLHLQTC